VYWLDTSRSSAIVASNYLASYQAHGALEDYLGRKARSAKAETPNAPAKTRIPARRASPIARANTPVALTDTVADTKPAGRMASMAPIVPCARMDSTPVSRVIGPPAAGGRRHSQQRVAVANDGHRNSRMIGPRRLTIRALLGTLVAILKISAISLRGFAITPTMT
jgi:hypothetical protein